MLTGKGGEGRFSVKYETFPISYDANLVVLDSDFEVYKTKYYYLYIFFTII